MTTGWFPRWGTPEIVAVDLDGRVRNRLPGGHRRARTHRRAQREPAHDQIDRSAGDGADPPHAHGGRIGRGAPNRTVPS
jgi:hypothetical protein